MINKLTFIFLISIGFSGLSQNKIELMTSDCTQENGFTMFQLDEANPQILTKQIFKKENGYWGGHKKIIQNQSDSLKIEYTNIFGQQIDTTFANAKELSKIKICVNKYKDYEKKSLIRQSIEGNKKWILSTSWGHQVFESDKLILKPKKGFLKFKYYKNGKRVKRGKIKITKIIINRISLFERKLNSMQNADGGCNFGVSYYLDNGIEKLNFQDNSCNGFSNDQLLTELKIIE
ncbi:hypothetical protein [Aequorivita xiaoshiensis]|uniref:Uncharacterized protein n=1 Tax=Aequorivita xiaoshiensis TaxID=2874476 RepID=A0A9X1U6Q8_9FLAO|nr:hypothetical protein [Aequorivita xiaoshiensis]MCG2431863.1 hypothetical protein [Aequorivita xiaoshiensis]